MIDIKVIVTDERAILAKLEKMTPEIMRRLEEAMEPMIKRVAAAQRARTPRRTGRLASQVGQTFIDKGPDFIRARATVVAGSGWQYGKAGALEYGAPGRRGRFTVREHKRRGRGIGMETIVDRYQRTAQLVEQRYLRGPFEAMRGEIEAALRAAVDDVVRELDAA